MSNFSKNRKNKYDKVMPRLNKQARSSLKSSSLIIRHEIPSSVRIGAKPSVSNSNMSTSVYSDLPIVLDQFVPESSNEKSRRTFVSKPRKTLKSLDPALSPPRNVTRPDFTKKPTNIQVPESTPVLLPSTRQKWTDTHMRQCHSSRSHSRIKDLKNEIQAYHETEKLMRIRSGLFKKCGVVLDDVGHLAADKAVQVEDMAAKIDGYGNAAPLTNGSAGSPLGRTAGSPPVTVAGPAGPSPMAALMSVTDTLPPGSPRSAGGSPPQPPPQRSASRSSQHSPNSSGSNGGRRSSGSRHVSSTTSVSSTEAGEGAEPTAPAPAPLLKCTLCQERLEDTHFVQCPSQPHHKFCFPCSRDSIKRQQGSEVYCPSGEKCPLANSTVPWAFMQGEIATILGEEFKPKKERET